MPGDIDLLRPPQFPLLFILVILTAPPGRPSCPPAALGVDHHGSEALPIAGAGTPSLRERLQELCAGRRLLRSSASSGCVLRGWKWSGSNESEVCDGAS